MDNLFMNIQKYRPREYINPKENFFTEILAYILNLNDILLPKFISLLGLSISSNEKAIVRTQCPYDGKFIDIEIVISDKNDRLIKSIFIENKLGSSVYEYEEENEQKIINQLDTYLKIQTHRKSKCDGYVILLTQYNEFVKDTITKQKRFKQIYWSDVYELFNNFSKHKSLNKVNKFLINQFVELMKSENMTSYKKIDIKKLESFGKQLDNILTLVDNVEKNLHRQRIKYKFCEPRLKENEFLSFAIKKIDRKEEEKVSLDYNYIEKAFVFYANIKRKELISQKLYSKLQDNGYSTSEDKDNYVPGKEFRTFFDLKTAQGQIDGLTNFCIEQIKLCEKLKIIRNR